MIKLINRIFRLKSESDFYFWLSGALMLLTNQFVYSGTRLINHGLFHHNMTIPLDAKVPYTPWIIVFYFGCFLYWFIHYWIMSRLPREESDRFFCSNVMSKIICLLFFVFLPTTMSRPPITGDTPLNLIYRFLYWIDPPDNLFPSLHCVFSWLCWIGVRRRKDIPAWYRWLTLVLGIGTCYVTLAIRQHVFVDTISGVLLIEICYWYCGKSSLLRKYSEFMDSLLAKVMTWYQNLTV